MESQRPGPAFDRGEARTEEGESSLWAAPGRPPSAVGRATLWLTTRGWPDVGVRFAFAGSLWSTVSGLVFLALVTWKLSPGEQGYYFTFSSLLMMQQFMELGFGIVLVQFVSHEWAFVSANADGRLSGSPTAIARLGSLVRLAIPWYAGVSVLFFVAVGTGGQVFFSSGVATGVAWALPWWLLCGAAALAVLLVPLSGFIEGSGDVARNQRILLVANIAGGSAAFATLLAGGALYAPSVLVGTRFLVGSPLLVFAARRFLGLWRQRSPAAGVDWRREFWPQQWRISTSWVAGFVTFQSFAPITFQAQGPVAAGQIGATVQVFHGINRLASAWLVGAQPRMGHVGARGRYDELDAMVGHTTRRSIATAAAFSIAALAGLGLATSLDVSWAGRFASLPATAVFLVVVVCMQVMNVQTAAIRFQKREPFVATAVVAAVLVAASTAAAGRSFGTTGVAIAFAAIILALILPWTAAIYRREIARAPGIRAAEAVTS